ncbi:META domain-containing protein [Thiorhodococcus mannitoliphagus]|uniref:META domain-containing protein n=1 Tax=Thiorhodococcus mannitoliphagus TaxID=329406 RepID=A0A6P1DUT0_9GAMM|nr:META domain-containing protein [Thiorhodococcus mannitoliphagus]NEX19454.1 META domain-containing protein [Thiorhodococcus mannitoliphagus]
MRRTMTTLAISIFAITLAAAATAAEPDAPAPASTFTVQLEGLRWTLTDYRSADGLSQVWPKSRPPRFSFQDGSFSGSTGCNRITGSYRLDGSILTIGKGLAATQMGCPAPLMAQEKAVIQALRRVATVHRKGATLELHDSADEVLLRFSLPQRTPLTGHTWKLESYDNGSAALTTPIPGSEITLKLDGEDRLSGHDGCNAYMSGYSLSGDALAFGPIATTRMACRGGPERAEQAGRYAAALTQAASYQLQGQELTILDANGKPMARFTSEATSSAQAATP